jgi:hypothetical protein
MTVAKRHLRQDVTHWPVTGSDGYGGFTYGTPVLLKGRWEDKAVLFLTLENEEVVSNAIVYLDTDIAVGDWFGLGDLTATNDPSTIIGTYRSRQYHKSTDLRALQALRKVFL